MAYLDSALDYSWEVVKIATSNSTMTVKYSVDSSLGLPDLYRRFTLLSTQFDSAGIAGLAEGGVNQVIAQWDLLEAADSDNPTFRDSAFVGKINNDRYKPRVTIPYSGGDYNTQLFKITQRDSESNDAITTLSELTARDSDEKIAFRQSTNITPRLLWDYIVQVGSTDSLGPALGFTNSTGGEVYAQASFDASAGAAFDFTTDAISSFGVDSVTRTGTGTFVVTFDTPISGGYTVITGIGDQDYSGAGASPRQTAVIARDSNSVTVVCERTDDAVNEDNGYISMAVFAAKSSDEYGSLSKKNVEFMIAPSVNFGDSYANSLQNALSLNDSDFCGWMIEAGASSAA